MKLEDAPQWVREMVANTVGPLKNEDTEITQLTDTEAVIRSGEFTYAVDKHHGRIF